MAADSRLMKRALERFREDKERREAEHRRQVAEIYQKVPRAEEITRELRSTIGGIVAAAFRNGTDPQSAIRALKEHNLSLQRERAELLVEHGYAYDALEDKPRCALCGDTGFTEAGPCRCLMAYYAREQNQELSKLLDLGNQSFDTFDFKWYDERYWPQEGTSPRENMEIIYELCAKYAHNFSSRSPNLLMTGAPGLGKTFLSACIAREVSNAGFSVVYDTATHVFAQFESGKFGRENPFDEDAHTDINRYLHCDLLIMDDLGTEMATAFVTSTLYQILNQRLVAGRQTILNTNLSLEDLGKRYGAATLSRIEGEYQILTFFGEDIRRQKREQ